MKELKCITVREVTPVSGNLVSTPEMVFNAWNAGVKTASWFDDQKECFVVFLLDTKNKCTGFSLVSLGTLDSSLVHPREVFRPAIAGSAARIIIAHNHPSGDPAPSAEDLATTRELILAGEVVGIPVTDHLVIGDTFLSMRAEGLVDFVA